MSKRAFRLFLLITSLSIGGLLALQVSWIIRSFEQQKSNYKVLTDIAVQQIRSKVLSYYSPDYLDVGMPFELAAGVTARSITEQTQPLRASRFLGYYRSGNDSLPVYGPQFIRDSISWEVLDSLIEVVASGLNLLPGYAYSFHDPVTDSILFKQGLPAPRRSPDITTQINITKSLNPVTQQTLKLVFPVRIPQMLLRMGWLLLTNVLLLILITGSFVFAFRIILRQKRIHEIRKDFINNLTHEFKTPVASVALALEGLQAYDLDSDPQKRSDYLTMARKENQRLALMIDRTLNMAAYERGAYDVHFETVDMHKVIREVAAVFEVHVLHRNGSLRQSLHAVNAKVSGDREHLQQIVYNLLDNANKYSDISPSIHITTANPNATILEISVSDQGIGIHPNRLKGIFKPYSRIPEKHQAPVKGFGLGLAYVKQIAELHQGSVSVSSAPGEGSCFTLNLPVE